MVIKNRKIRTRRKEYSSSDSESPIEFSESSNESALEPQTQIKQQSGSSKPKLDDDIFKSPMTYGSPKFTVNKKRVVRTYGTKFVCWASIASSTPLAEKPPNLKHTPFSPINSDQSPSEFMEEEGENSDGWCTYVAEEGKSPKERPSKHVCEKPLKKTFTSAKEKKNVSATGNISPEVDEMVKANQNLVKGSLYETSTSKNGVSGNKEGKSVHETSKSRNTGSGNEEVKSVCETSNSRNIGPGNKEMKSIHETSNARNEVSGNKEGKSVHGTSKSRNTCSGNKEVKSVHGISNSRNVGSGNKGMKSVHETSNARNEVSGNKEGKSVHETSKSRNTGSGNEEVKSVHEISSSGNVGSGNKGMKSVHETSNTRHEVSGNKEGKSVHETSKSRNTGSANKEVNSVHETSSSRNVGSKNKLLTGNLKNNKELISNNSKLLHVVPEKSVTVGQHCGGKTRKEKTAILEERVNRNLEKIKSTVTEVLEKRNTRSSNIPVEYTSKNSISSKSVNHEICASVTLCDKKKKKSADNENINRSNHIDDLKKSEKLGNKIQVTKEEAYNLEPEVTTKVFETIQKRTQELHQTLTSFVTAVSRASQKPNKHGKHLDPLLPRNATGEKENQKAANSANIKHNQNFDSECAAPASAGSEEGEKCDARSTILKNAKFPDKATRKARTKLKRSNSKRLSVEDNNSEPAAAMPAASEEEENSAPLKSVNLPDKITGTVQTNVNRKSSKRLCVEDNDSGIRKSKRQRVPPVLYWKGERVHYEPIDHPECNIMYEVVGVVRPRVEDATKRKVHNATENRLKKRAKNVKQTYGERNAHYTEDILSLSRSVLATSDILEKIPMRLNDKLEDVECVAHFSKSAFEPLVLGSGQTVDGFQYQPCLSVSGFTNGFLKIAAGASRQEEINENTDLLLFVARGRVDIIVNDHVVHARPGSSVIIPRGILYKIDNNSPSETLLSYATKT